MRVVVLIGFLLPTFYHSQTWTQFQDFPGNGRDDAAMFMISQKAYCVSGKSTNNCERDMFVFDCANESWTGAASLPPGEERQYASAFSWNGKGYLLCGVDCNDILKKDFFRYDPSINLWSALPDFTGSARHGAHAAVLNDKVYLMGGYNGNFLNEVWMFDLVTEIWTQKNNLPLSGFWRGASFVINGKIHIAYGFTNSNNYNHFIYEYDELNDSWTVVNNILLPARKYISCAVVNNQLFCYGGQDSLNSITNSLIIIDVNTQTTNTLSGIPSVARKGGVGFSYNNQFFISTGFDENETRTKETWKHDGVVGLNGRKNKIEDLMVYPNPALEKIVVASKHTIEKLIVYNSEGDIIYFNNSPKSETEIDVSGFPAGAYFILIFSELNFFSEKFIVWK